MVKVEELIKRLEEKNKEAIPLFKKAYQMAESAHSGVFRESGEPYITHPLEVVKNLLDIEVYDTDTLCAALLHDVVEDTSITLEDIRNTINPTVAELVDGVTKMRRMNFSTEEEQVFANTRKIINGLTKDIRIILIKLADRLHNMRTLTYKRPAKQKENAIETMELFVPLALSIGAYQVKSELEDLALMYIEPNVYDEILGRREEYAKVENAYLEELKRKLQKVLQERNIPNEILLRTRNVCSIYRKIVKGYEMKNIYDIFYLKILVQEIDDCYRTLRQVHAITPPINGRFKDYIFNPRTNHYQSLHTTGADTNGKLVKTKIRTFDMNKVSAYGIPAYWNLDPKKPETEFPTRKTIAETQAEIREKLQFAKRLQEIDSSFRENRDFFREIKQELLTEHVYVYTHSGEIIELPMGSTALDFACQVHPDELDAMTGVIVNGKQVPVNTILRNNDTVQIDTNGMVNREDWENSVKTYNGKTKIKVLINRQKHEQAL